MHFKEDSKPDEVTKLFAGDVVHIEEGSHNTLITPNKAKCKINCPILFDRVLTDSTLLPQFLVYLMLHHISTPRTSLGRSNSDCKLVQLLLEIMMIILVLTNVKCTEIFFMMFFESCGILIKAFFGFWEAAHARICGSY